ncbi:MAG: hypothetical protein U0805_09765 [Pirellulales bacterium]
MRYRCLLIAAAVVIAFGVTRPASAILPFYNQFKKDFLDDHPDKKFVEEVTSGQNKCLICHQGTKSKKNKNAFGVEVGKLLDKKKDAKDTEKISASLKKALAAHVDPKDEKSDTYMDRIKASKWPGGNLEDLKKEPKDSKESEGDEKK